jgi:predicted nuclease with RNAse H fold
VRYCGVVGRGEQYYLCALEEVRAPEPPIRLTASFYEPGEPERVAAELRALREFVVGIASPLSIRVAGRVARACDEELGRRGVRPESAGDGGATLLAGLPGLDVYVPAAEGAEGAVEEAAFRAAPLFETNVEAVFCALQERRVPAKRHPLGIQRRIEELTDEHVVDEGGDLWHRRIEEIDAAAAALCAHRYAVGHARWLGDPAEGVIVLPGSGPLERFTTEGVLPPVTRRPLAEAE